MAAAAPTSFSTITATSKSIAPSKIQPLSLGFLSSSSPSLKPLRAAAASGSAPASGSALGARMVSVPAIKPLTSLDFETSVFTKEKVNLAGHEEVFKAEFERAKHYGKYVKDPFSLLATAIAWISAKLDSKKQEKSMEELKDKIEELKKRGQREDQQMDLVAGEWNEEVANVMIAEEGYEEVANLVVAEEGYEEVENEVEGNEEEDTPEQWENPFN